MSSAKEAIAEAEIQTAAEWLMTDDSLYQAHPDAARRAAEGMLRAIRDRKIARPLGTDIWVLPDGRHIRDLPLAERLRAMAYLMHAGSAWGFCGEAMWLEEAADRLEGKVPV